MKDSTGNGKRLNDDRGAKHKLKKRKQEFSPTAKSSLSGKIAGKLSPAMFKLIIIFLVLISLASSWTTIVRVDRAMRRELLLQAEMITRAINVEHVKTLQGSNKDLTTSDYQRLKEQLAAIASANEKAVFIYLMAQKADGSIFFLVDNVQPDSEDYSAPGDPYDEASPELIDIFKTTESLVEGPVIDPWGVWISALVPINDPQTGSVLALLGIDYDATTWRIDVAKRSALPVLLIISSFLILSLMLILWRNREEIKTRRTELQRLKEFNEGIVQNADEGIIICDQEGIIEFANPALAGMLGLNEEDLLGRNWLDFVPEPLKGKAREADTKRAEGQSERYMLELQHKNGYTVPVQISANPRYNNKTGQFAGSLAVMTDVSSLLQAERAVRESEEKYRLIFEHSPLGILHYDQRGIITDCNEEFVKIIGSSYEQLVGLDMLQLPDTGIVNTVKKSLQGETAVYEDYYQSVTAPKITPVRGIFAPIQPGVSLTDLAEGGIGIIEDITLRKQAEEKIRHMSFHDQLTDLYNRHYLEEELTRLDTERQLPISIIMADLNGLKLVNDTYGHLVGDQLLCRAAEIIRQNSRSEDIVARWGGDEFIILLPQTGNEKASQVTRRIADACKNVYIEDIPLSIAIGIATKKDFDTGLIETLKQAEDNMYEQKLTESRSTKSAVLGALLKTLAAKSFETENHTRNMQAVAVKIGKALNLPNSEINRLILLITLHDIGKINIPEELLTKKDRLTEEEWDTMKKHPETGYRIAMATEEFAHVANDILSHHERYDGTGYPRGLKGSAIPLLARITAVADAYEVMSNGRPYKKAMSKEEIIGELKNCAGSHFDPELVKILLTILKNDEL